MGVFPNIVLFNKLPPLPLMKSLKNLIIPFLGAKFFLMSLILQMIKIYPLSIFNCTHKCLRLATCIFSMRALLLHLPSFLHQPYFFSIYQRFMYLLSHTPNSISTAMTIRKPSYNYSQIPSPLFTPTLIALSYSSYSPKPILAAFFYSQRA